MSFRRKKYLILVIVTTFFIVSISLVCKRILDLNIPSKRCASIKATVATINTNEVYSSFDFDAEWKSNKIFWNEHFETEFKEQSKGKFPLKVFILPHSHNDPGWLRTFTNYYELETSKILDLIVEKLTEYEDLRFVWTEISFLDLWWDKATASQQKALKNLVKSGRLEIMTGGWVMTDEANVHLYAMLDQLIEGHQWIGANLGVAPKIGWSIDPFGQGSTVPHLLAKSGFEGAIIQRIHYNWKEWLARHKYGDFYWNPLWDNRRSSEYTLLTHNMPFDLYSTSKSCGPNEEVCERFGFHGAGLSQRVFESVNDKNVKSLADALVEQYSKNAFLYPHNVALVLVGDDFAYSNDQEFTERYKNYKKLIKYVNSNSKTHYNGAKIQFGTPTDYFKEIKSRLNGNFPSLVGDFFPYADIFSSGSPDYWTGYYTTRPFYKLLSRILEHNLRNAEILFNIGYNKALQSKTDYKESRRMEKDYEMLIEARKNLGLFQHHDSITGTSQLHVMEDHLNRLETSVQTTLNMQERMIEFLLQEDVKKQRNFIFYEFEARDKPRVIRVTKENPLQKIVLFNSLASKRVEVVSFFVTEVSIKVTDQNGQELRFQINPFIQIGTMGDMKELLILVELPALSLSIITIKFDSSHSHKNAAEIISDITDLKDMSIENSKMKLLFDENSGFMKEVHMKQFQRTIKSEIEIGGYKSSSFRSGAYLFKPEHEIDNLFDLSEVKIVVFKGPIASDVIVMYSKTLLLVHSVRIYSTDSHLDDAVSVQNIVDFGSKENNGGLEMFMRIKTSIKNDKSGEPEFFTDQNGFQWLPRRKVSKLPVEGNYYPITSSVFIQDDTVRLTLATTHAQGVTSMQKGELEIMIDRRTVNDDGRGMGEGVLDSVKMQHKFCLTFEVFESYEDGESVPKYQVPSLYAHHVINTLNYPVNTFHVDSNIESQLINKKELFRYQFPCDVHLVNLRSLSDEEIQWLPIQSSLLILHRLGYECELKNEKFQEQICDQSDNPEGIQIIEDVKIKQINEASLTGLEIKKKIKSFYNTFMEPMDIKSYHISYVESSKS